MRISGGVLAGGLGLVLVVACGDGPRVVHASTAPADVPRSVELRITPGKPGAPTELVRLSESTEAGRHAGELYLARVDAEGEPLGEERVALPVEELERVWRVAGAVTFDGHAELRVNADAVPVMDFGLRSLTLTLGRSGADRARLELQWTRPLPDGDALRAAVDAVVAVAREHGQTLRLHYLPR